MSKNVILDVPMNLTQRAIEELNAIRDSGDWNEFKKFQQPMEAKCIVEILNHGLTGVSCRFKTELYYEGWVFASQTVDKTLTEGEKFTFEKLEQSNPLVIDYGS